MVGSLAAGARSRQRQGEGGSPVPRGASQRRQHRTESGSLRGQVGVAVSGSGGTSGAGTTSMRSSHASGGGVSGSRSCHRSTSPGTGDRQERTGRTMQVAYLAHAAYAQQGSSPKEGRTPSCPSSQTPGASVASTATPSLASGREGDEAEEPCYVPGPAEECMRLRLERADERRRREAAEREVTELRRRLRRAADEVRFWREKCEAVEASTSFGRPVPRGGATRETEVEEEPGVLEEELVAIESVVDQLCQQRAAFTGDLEEVKRQLLVALELSGG